MPSAFKQLVDATSVTQFYVTSTDGKSAEIWPLPEWEKREQQLADSSTMDDAVRKYLNVTSYYGQQVEMDNQARLLLPQILRNAAQLDGEVTVFGMRTYLEVHNREASNRILRPTVDRGRSQGYGGNFSPQGLEAPKFRAQTPQGEHMSKRMNVMCRFFYKMRFSFSMYAQAASLQTAHSALRGMRQRSSAALARGDA